ncbi:9953_t:CDS:2 [Dentiscutata erythropus]|uniref:9953_t:CDS:1 n=1 Tax=Dentiscutata erythropus TaxID=1348616 RepID=A0A9N8WHU6_9GLOM|nr:9953_t:CDS:2 [Dentiscutata erythropus]
MDEKQKVFTKVKAAEYTNKYRQDIYGIVEYVQQKKEDLNYKLIIFITGRRLDKRYSSYISSPLNDGLRIALFNTGIKTKPYDNNEYEKHASDQKEEMIHALEDDNNIDIVNVDWELDSDYTEARKMELDRWDFYLRRKYQIRIAKAKWKLATRCFQVHKYLIEIIISVANFEFGLSQSQPCNTTEAKMEILNTQNEIETDPPFVTTEVNGFINDLLEFFNDTRTQKKSRTVHLIMIKKYTS